MKSALQAMGVWRVVTGEKAQPGPGPDLEKYYEMWDRAAGTLKLKVENGQETHYEGFEDNPQKIWTLLEAAHVSKKPAMRFNAYADLFSIRKREDESLSAVMIRIDQAMQQIRNLRPPVFSITDLDDELQSMAMITSLPSEYDAFRSSIMLLDQIDKKTLQEAFRNEEINRLRSQGNNSSLVSSKALAVATPTPPPAVSCEFCGIPNHTLSQCYKFKAAQQKTKEEVHSRRRNRRPGAKSAQEEPSTSVESAGNASLHSFAPSGHPSKSQLDTHTHWNADTGASSTMTPNRHWMHNYTPYCIPIRLADDTIVYSAGIGSVLFLPEVEGKKSDKIVEFTRVLHVPQLGTNLLAVLYLTRRCGYQITIDHTTMHFVHQNQVLFTATIGRNNAAFLNGTTLTASEHAQLVSTLPLDYSLWHRRLAHHNLADVKRMIQKDLVTGVQLRSTSAPDPICEPCLAGKMHANPFPSSEHRASKPLELIHSDVHGPVVVRTRSGFRYWVTFIDDYTRLWVVYLLKHKSDTFVAFKLFKAWAENHFNALIKALRDDKAGEYMSKEFNDFCDASGIERQHTVRNRPQQNGVAERVNRDISDGTTAMLAESGLPLQFWDDAVASFVHVRNRCGTSTIKNGTPYQEAYGHKPDISHLRIWGCTAYVHVQKDKRRSLGPHMEKCVFIGYPAGYKGWKFYNPTTKKTIICERAEFDERSFLLKPSNPPLPPLLPNTQPDPVAQTDVQVPDLRGDDDLPPQNDAVIPALAPAPAPLPLAPLHVQPPLPEVPIPENAAPDRPASPVRPPTPPLALRHEPRARRPPGEWWKVPAPPPPPPVIPSEEPSSSDDELDLIDHDLEHADLAAGDEPTLAQAMKSPDADKWRQAMQEEYLMHLENRTWEIVKLPPGKKAIGSGWVFRVKRNPDGSVERYKGRLVAKGFSQRPGQDYTEVFAPASRSASVRLVLAISAIEDLHLHSVDIFHAFIHDELEEEIYMKQPEGFEEMGPDYVCKLQRSLYGLKQAGRVWNKKLHSVLTLIGFKRLESDCSIYLYLRDDVKIIMPIHVDDLTLASSSQSAIDHVVKELTQHFKLRDLGPTTFLLGIEITRDRSNRSISISQHQYIVEMLERFGLSDANPVSTPMDPGLRLDATMSAKTPEELSTMCTIPYLSAVGALLYLATMTRPDVANAVSILARFSSNPGIAHWKAVKHLFRYLKGTKDLKLVYRPDNSGELFTSYCDADHAGSKDNGRSTGGYLIKMGTGAISWRSKLQPIVALSTTEAEYIAAVEAGKEVVWLRNILGELGYKFTSPSTLNCDNQSAISVAKNPEHHGRMKHLDLRFYWLRDTVENGMITPKFIPTADMPADLLTKPLPRAKVEICRKLMGLERCGIRGEC